MGGGKSFYSSYNINVPTAVILASSQVRLMLKQTVSYKLGPSVNCPNEKITIQYNLLEHNHIINVLS